MPWYTTPTALAIFATLTKPAIVHEECALSGDFLPMYAVPEALADYHAALVRDAFANDRDNEALIGELLTATPQFVLNVLFGSAGYFYPNDFAIWDVIAADLAAARAVEVAA